jgi:S-(hydroxymethyl)glutathione dehydrogenase / alcohol dehydrogenase
MEYPLKFKAAILEKNREALIIKDVIFKGPLEPGQVLVKISYSGICGKQIEEIDGTRQDPFLPHMLGHEGGGYVVDIGPSVTKVSLNDHVVLHWMKGSGINASTPQYYDNLGMKINAGWITTFNEYGVISENRVTKIPKRTNLELACLLGCCVTTGVGVILNEAHPLPEDSVAIYGCGGVGLNSIQAAKLLNAYPIIAVDNNDESLELAKEFGATHTLNSTKVNPINEIKKITNNSGAQYVIVTTGNLKGIESAVESASFPSEVYLVGVPPENSRITIDPLAVHRSRVLHGSCGGAIIPERDIQKYLKLYEKGFLKLDELISHTFCLNNINKAIEVMRSGKAGRCTLHMAE